MFAQANWWKAEPQMVGAAVLSTTWRRKRDMAKYGGTAQKEVKKSMHEFKRGKLKSGGKGKAKAKSRKQAIAIGLSKARKKGGKVPARSKS
jgi:hypothetical protein